MPPEATHDEPVENRTMDLLDLSPEIEVKPEVPDPECGPVIEPFHPRWARIMSAIFSPILIPTYCMIMAMWLTSLSELPESTRFGATVVVFLLTGITPMVTILTLIKMGWISEFDIPTRNQRYFPTAITIVCFGLTAYYLYCSMAPVWLVMIIISGCVSSLLLLLFNTFYKVSGHALGMGTMTGVVCFLAAHGLSDMRLTPWIIAIILLSGLVGSARLALDRHTPGQIALGYVIGLVVTYFVSGLELFARLTPEITVTAGTYPG